MTISVLQGARPMAKDNKEIGRFNLDGIAPAPKGVPQIEVSFEIDVNGLLSVTAKDKATGIEQKITIESRNSVSQEEIDRIKREAEEHAEEDAKTKERLENANRCDSLIFSTEKLLENMKDHVTDEDRKFFDEKVDTLKKIKETEDYSSLDDIESKINARWNDISRKAYATGSQGTAENPFNINMEDIVNGNFAQNANAAPPNNEGGTEEQEATVL